jgi:hypothetical protein
VARAEVDTYVEEALPDLDPVIAHELTDYGWRGLTADGEVLEVKSTNGHAARIPDGDLIITCAGKAIGRRRLAPAREVDISGYLEYFNVAVECYKTDQCNSALIAADMAIALYPTLRARFNRAMILLALGRWREGFAEYHELEEHAPFIRPQVKEALAAGLTPWRGENINGKRVLLLHAHGFGDSLMTLRYVRQVEAMGAEVILHVPHELTSLAAQCGTISTNSIRDIDADYFCPLLHLVGRLDVKPWRNPDRSYLTVAPQLVDKWRQKITGEGKRIGIAWTVGKPSIGDYPRAIPLAALLAGLDPEAEIYSVQAQAPDQRLFPDIHTFEFEDFADCAALMLLMDVIISVDTAAVHLAGAIGHPNVSLLLSHWHSWRWIKPWYGTVKICRQTSPGDWASAVEQAR